MQLNIIEFMKSLTKYREIDSLDIFYEKANEFLGNDNAPSDPVLPENPQEAYALGKMLYRLGVYSDSEDWLKMAAQYNIGGWVTSALESNIGLAAIAQWVATLMPLIPQGLGTGNLFTNNFASPLVQEKDYITIERVHRDYKIITRI